MALEKAILTNTVTNDRIPVMFNPEEYTMNRDINYAQIGVPGQSEPITQFVHGNMPTLEMELLLDTYESHREGSKVLNQAGDDVRNFTDKIMKLMEIDSSTHAPPVALFTWGSLSFTSLLARASQKFIMFLPDGTPVRARLTVTFNHFLPSDLESKEVKRQTADFTKVHVVLGGENLSSIAAQEYNNPALWRPIALMNGIENPRQLRVGMNLTIPKLPFVDPLTGEVMN